MIDPTQKPQSNSSCCNNAQVMIRSALILYESLFITEIKKLKSPDLKSMSDGLMDVIKSYGDSVVMWRGPIDRNGSMFLIFGLKPEDALQFEVLCPVGLEGFFTPDLGESEISTMN